MALSGAHTSVKAADIAKSGAVLAF